MEYVLTFDDGSSAYLAHHGVLGMKWGVRNAETRRKYAGGNGRSEKRQALKESRTRQRTAHQLQAQSYINESNSIRASRKSGSITKDQARKKNIKLADAYQKKYDQTTAKGRLERAKIKSEGKSAKAQNRIMARAKGSNVYDATSAKGLAYSRRQSVGKQAAKLALMGVAGTMSYNSARAAGKNRVRSTGYAAVGQMMGGNFIPFDEYAYSQRRKTIKQEKAKFKKSQKRA